MVSKVARDKPLSYVVNDTCAPKKMVYTFTSLTLSRTYIFDVYNTLAVLCLNNLETAKRIAMKNYTMLYWFVLGSVRSVLLH